MASHLPGIDPGMEGRGFNARLPNAAAGKRLAETVDIGARSRGVRHPDLLIGPAFRLRTRRHRLSEQRPLRAIGGASGINEVGSDVPPFDAEVRVRAVISRKNELLVRDDR